MAAGGTGSVIAAGRTEALRGCAMAIKPSLVVIVLICLGTIHCAPQKPDPGTAPVKMEPVTEPPPGTASAQADTSGLISKMMKHKTVRHKTRPTKRAYLN